MNERNVELSLNHPKTGTHKEGPRDLRTGRGSGRNRGGFAALATTGCPETAVPKPRQVQWASG